MNVINAIISGSDDEQKLIWINIEAVLVMNKSSFE